MNTVPRENGSKPCIAAMIGSAARFTEPLRYPDYLAYDAFAA